LILKKKIDLKFEVRNENKNIDTMTTQQQGELVATCNAVKGELKKSNRRNRYYEKEIDERDEWVIEKLPNEDKWLYVEKFGVGCPYLGCSEIKLYTNKKGFKSLVHYNGNRYIGSVKANGKTPIAVTKWEVPTKDKWVITDNKFVRLRQDIRAFFSTE